MEINGSLPARKRKKKKKSMKPYVKISLSHENVSYLISYRPISLLEMLCFS